MACHVRRQMKETQQSQWFDLLHIFAYGTYADYKGTWFPQTYSQA